MTRATEQWRNDPARRRAAEDLAHARNRAVTTARQHLQAAYDALDQVRDLGCTGAGAQLMGLRNKTWTALSAAKQISTDLPSDTLIGGMAVFGEGWRQ